MEYKLSRYIHIVKDDELLSNRLIVYSTRSSAIVEMPVAQFECIERADFSSLPLESVKKLMDYSILVPKAEDELTTILEENKARIDDSRVLGYTIQPTANCQLGCHYCAQSHSKNVMSTNVADHMLDRITEKIKSGKFDVLQVTWYGGEPLTGLSSIEYTSKLLQELAAENKVRYAATMITNGLALKPKIFERLVTEHQLKMFQITLDGTAEFHDKRRMLKNGNPSFDIIMDNVTNIVLSDFFAASDVDIQIRCNVNVENKDNIFQLMDFLKERNLHDKVNFKIARVENWGGNKAGATENGGLDKHEFAQFEIDVMLKRLSEGFKIDHTTIIPRRVKSVCMVTNKHDEVVDGFGNISTCWEVPYTPIAENPDFVAGNIVTEKTKVDSSGVAMRNWYNEIPTNESWCKSCKFLPVCGGACPKSWYEGNPACPSFKFNIDERIIMKKYNVVA
ncbi:uncharacterized protein SAMN05660461_1408 [Chitinophaga ginsengisegetis]|uniref:Radical SAM core domain-containing protein n=1 Tax=Chitinophaga ginsengisegetis TaxID=393003 RepID=A0A1T5NFF3_9BACT|nr:radical SAM protein [Chitinophaga ginsengisegetis]SKC99215.1 uncharacterized protein SAMN05660461_1408 [Chitinophaga ginsengisegetis]